MLIADHDKAGTYSQSYKLAIWAMHAWKVTQALSSVRHDEIEQNSIMIMVTT